MKLSIILVHGIGDQKKDWAMEIEDDLKKKIPTQIKTLLNEKDPLKAEDILEIQSVYWKDIFKKREEELKRILNKSGNPVKLKAFWLKRLIQLLRMWWNNLQNIIITDYIGDIIGYLNGEAKKEVQQRIAEAIIKIKGQNTPQSSKSPVTFIAHSLGTVIVSDFIYDRQKERQNKNEEGFNDKLYLDNLFTIGSPVALFSLRFGGPEAFKSPIHIENQKTGRWLNIYDKDDPVGMPLKPLNEPYKEAVFLDVKVDAGIYGLSHVEYFKKKETLTIISRKLAIDWIALNQKKTQGEVTSLYADFDKTLGILK